MKEALRSAAKRVFYTVHPALRALWFPIKRLEYLAVYPFLSLLPLAWAHRIFRVRWPWLLFLPSEKDLILRNLSDAFRGKLSPSQLSATGSAYARFLSCLRFDAWMSSACSAKRLNEAVRFEGISRLREAQERGKAVVLLGCHTGYFYRFVFALARNGYRHQVITMRTEETGRIVWRGRAERMLYRKILERMEREENVRVIYAGSAYRAIQEALEDGRVLLTKMDNPMPAEGDKGVCLRFLGRQSVFPARIFRMARQHDALCLPYIVHVDKHHCRIEIHPPREPGCESIPPEEEITAQMEYFIRLFEKHILSHPEQWWLWRDLGAFGMPSDPHSCP